MREILFRGKRTDNGEWVMSGNIIHFNDEGDGALYYIPQLNERCICRHDETDNIESFENSMFYKVIPETVGQYTGLTDKYGKKIFEGDIVKVPSFDPSVMCITFIEGAFCLANNKGEYAADIHYIHHANNNQTEIIGNIHDNPELLGEEPTEAESDIGNG